ncbi:hypothetical protein LZK73_18320 [Neorhizobium galegae]|nr:hypothetical protein LZK73_18320 [Neorhizobium galegae]
MATILPTGETYFTDQNGDPLAGGTIAFYVPNTTVPKDTYKDSQQLVFNTNPVVLDASGRAIIFGSGSYRQVVKDSLGNLIWDQITGEPNAGIVSSGGTSGGTVNAQTLTAGTFDGTDGATIQFIAGLSNTGPMTISVGGAAPIAVLKNGPSGPVPLALGDIIAGNIYSVAYSAVQASFQLLTSIPPTFSIASQATAEAGTNNTDLMTALRVRQAREQPRADIASAATTSLGTLSSQFIRITGSVAITSFGVADAGTRKHLQFAAPLTLTHNATSLILPNNGNNIVTAAGDTCVAISLGAGNWVIVSYQRAASSNAPIGEGQTWQNVTGQRLNNVIYQNTTGRSIAVKAIGNGPGAAIVYIGPTTTLETLDFVTVGAGLIASADGIVPPGWFYRVYLDTPNRIMELR